MCKGSCRPICRSRTLALNSSRMRHGPRSFPQSRTRGQRRPQPCSRWAGQSAPHRLGGAADGRLHGCRGGGGRAVGLARAAGRCGPHADRCGRAGAGVARLPHRPAAVRLEAHLWVPSVPGARGLQQRVDAVLHRAGHCLRGVSPPARTGGGAGWPDAGGRGRGAGGEYRRLPGAARGGPRQPQRPRRDAARAGRSAGVGGGHRGGAGDPVDGVDADRPAAVGAGGGSHPAQRVVPGRRSPATFCWRRRPRGSTCVR